MTQINRLPLSVLDTFPAVNEKRIHRLFEEEYRTFGRKVLTLDDDPTGVQTVHGVRVYTDWKQESLEEAVAEPETLTFVLTNSRSFSAEETEREHEVLTKRAVIAAKRGKKGLLLVSRGDSTLRGHYPLELEVMRRVLEKQTGKKVDGQILCPFFREGGRFTIHGVHYVKEGEWLVPAGETEFAEDKTFGFRASHLGDYVEEKSGGRYRRGDCVEISLELLRAENLEAITALLMAAENFQPVLVDAVAECDVEIFAVCLLRCLKAGKEFLIRSAAALPKVLGNISSRPLLGREELVGRSAESDGYGGLVLIGSHVQKTTRQLEKLRSIESPAEFIEFNVNSHSLPEERDRVIAAAEKAMEQGKTAVVYTSRRLLAPEGKTREELLQLSVSISDAVTGVAAGLHRKPRFLIAKGGITSSDVGTGALAVHRALVLGQVQPGVPVWQTGSESKFPGLSYIIFPGNVGEDDTLKRVVELLT